MTKEKKVKGHNEDDEVTIIAVTPKVRNVIAEIDLTSDDEKEKEVSSGTKENEEVVDVVTEDPEPDGRTQAESLRLQVKALGCLRRSVAVPRPLKEAQAAERSGMGLTTNRERALDRNRDQEKKSKGKGGGQKRKANDEKGTAQDDQVAGCSGTSVNQAVGTFGNRILRNFRYTATFPKTRNLRSPRYTAKRPKKLDSSSSTESD